MDDEVLKIAEALILRDSLQLYLGKLQEYKGQPNYEQTMAFVGALYKKYSKIASTKCQTDEAGRITVRRDIRRDFDLN
jgi:hypothetical protein